MRHLIPTLATSAIIWSAAPLAAPNPQNLVAHVTDKTHFTSNYTQPYRTYWHHRYWHRHWWHHWRHWHRW